MEVIFKFFKICEIKITVKEILIQNVGTLKSTTCFFFGTTLSETFITIYYASTVSLMNFMISQIQALSY